MLLLGATPSFASALWATNSGSSSSIALSQIDAATGAVIATRTVATGLSSASLDDLTSDPIREPSVIWGVRWSAFVNQLVAIDPFQNTLISSVQLTSPTAIHSLAIDPTTGLLYGAGGTSLYRIARDTGIATLVGAGSTSLDRALGFDSAGNLYGIATNNSLLAVDKSTGASTAIAPLSASMADIAARPENSVMYGLGLASNYSLFQIDLGTGALTNVGASLLRPASLAFTAQSTASGDFNADGVVDTRDYVVWRNGLGTIYTPADYDVWRAHFGQTAATGAADAASAIPEPASILLALLAASLRASTRRATILL